eukprot:5310011-Pleurochrysis_carterae.AAC.1
MAVCCSPCSFIGSADLEHMPQMPDPFDAPRIAEERKLLTLHSDNLDTGIPCEAQPSLEPYMSLQAAAPAV